MSSCVGVGKKKHHDFEAIGSLKIKFSVFKKSNRKSYSLNYGPVFLRNRNQSRNTPLDSTLAKLLT